ncbi:hypothetical protein FORC53_1525 [Vibrio vulnificus]|uniref:Uncharacterized protein n=1 Tax=Vibrio vulnificus TaxID=672 RepID=A0AAN1PMU8_VIBVL|nr:hypothetical protein FORC53_1525 [Vibrio vulnificus]
MQDNDYYTISTGDFHLILELLSYSSLMFAFFGFFIGAVSVFLYFYEPVPKPKRPCIKERYYLAKLIRHPHFNDILCYSLKNHLLLKISI